VENTRQITAVYNYLCALLIDTVQSKLQKIAGWYLGMTWARKLLVGKCERDCNEASQIYIWPVSIPYLLSKWEERNVL